MNYSNSTIEETFTLPSHGKIYTDPVNEHFKLRSMTINEEMQRLAPSDRKYKVLCDIIDKCMVESPGISSYDMCLGDYVYCLYMLRIVTYGDEYKISPQCRYCKNINDIVFNLKDLVIKEYTEEIGELVEFELPDSHRRITLNPLTPRIMDTIEERVEMYKRKISKDYSSNILSEILYNIAKIDGIEMNDVRLEEFVRTLSMKDVNTIINYSRKLNGSIGVDTNIIVQCDMCGLTTETQLAITSEFFRPTLDI